MKPCKCARQAAFLILTLLVLFFPVDLVIVRAGAAPTKMRPYAGIGILVPPPPAMGESEPPEPLRLYEEPALSRLSDVDLAKVPPYEWILGAKNQAVPLIVMARKGIWLRVVFDDAGREAWLSPPRRSVFLPWNQFFKGRNGQMLPGLQKRYYQLFQHPGKMTAAALSPGQAFRVLRLDGDWAMIMQDQNSLGWIRWRDEDGRLLVGLERPVSSHKR